MMKSKFKEQLSKLKPNERLPLTKYQDVYYVNQFKQKNNVEITYHFDDCELKVSYK